MDKRQNNVNYYSFHILRLFLKYVSNIILQFTSVVSIRILGINIISPSIISPCSLFQIVVSLGWALAFAVGVSVVYGTYFSYGDLPFQSIWSNATNVIYGTFSRVGWALSLSWVVFACYYGYGGKVKKWTTTYKMVNQYFTFRCAFSFFSCFFYSLILNITDSMIFILTAKNEYFVIL